MKIKLYCILPVMMLGVMLPPESRVATSQNESSLIAIICANVIDGVSNEPLRDVTVIISNGKIEQNRAG